MTEKHDPWDPEPEIVENITKYVEQVYKHLKKGGLFLHITFAQPHFRSRFLKLGFENVQVITLGGGAVDGFEYYIYKAIK